jgi:preprotein translocase subunit SecD
MQKQRSLIAVILVLVLAALVALSQVGLRLGLDLRGGAQLTLQVQTTQEVPQITERVMEAVLSVVRSRVNELGVSETVVQTVGNNRILVQLPGVSDPEQAERVLGGTAQLDFRTQKRNTTDQLQQLLAQREVLRSQREDLLDRGNQEELAEVQAELDRVNEQIEGLFERTGLTGSSLEDALPNPVGNNNWNVSLNFDRQGGEKFAEMTKNLAGTGRTLGIFLDDKLISSPIVDAQYAETGITGGRVEIRGNFTVDEANNLAVQLRSGALPVPVNIVENRTVGATLGRDSIRSSIFAAIGGLILVLIYMVAYYRLPGAIADVALSIYTILTLAAFSLLGVTLTLPGIAGFILSIGMAVDANVLIFERTREELRSGKSLYRSVESGFYRAFSSILDSNVTTLIACGALFWLGAGLVRGFALTLAIGVVISMFTAITCSRTFMFLSISIPDFRKPELFCPNLPSVKSRAEVAE